VGVLHRAVSRRTSRRSVGSAEVRRLAAYSVVAPSHSSLW
jgi:hypothetical protein